jgi:hypothetical protein
MQLLAAPALELERRIGIESNPYSSPTHYASLALALVIDVALEDSNGLKLDVGCRH